MRWVMHNRGLWACDLCMSMRVMPAAARNQTWEAVEGNRTYLSNVGDQGPEGDRVSMPFGAACAPHHFQLDVDVFVPCSTATQGRHRWRASQLDI